MQKNIDVKGNRFQRHKCQRNKFKGINAKGSKINKKFLNFLKYKEFQKLSTCAIKLN